jgi:hypothetical protein
MDGRSTRSADRPTPLLALPLLLLVLLGPLPAAAQESPGAPDPEALVERLAAAYGVSAFGELDEVRFTFNVERQRERVVQRSWAFSPGSGEVTYAGPDPDGNPTEVRFRHADVYGDPDHELAWVDAHFVNDHYWLAFPLRVVIDSGTSFTAEGGVSLPVAAAEGTRYDKLTVQYGGGGYTPGDAYDLYLDATGVIRAWVYRRGGGSDGRFMYWSPPVALGPVRVSMDHWSENGEVRVFFTGVSARLGEDQVHLADPGER